MLTFLFSSIQIILNYFFFFLKKSKKIPRYFIYQIKYLIKSLSTKLKIQQNKILLPNHSQNFSISKKISSTRCERFTLNREISKKKILSILGSIARERFTFDFQKENILSIEPRVVNDTLNREQKGNGKSLR